MNIDIIQEFHIGLGSIDFFLEVTGNPDIFPVYVGCSFRVNSEIIDQPARWLKSPGKIVWEVNEDREKIYRSRTGEVIFAVYSDDSFAKRLADTGWYKWQAFGSDVIGTAKTKAAMKSFSNTEWKENMNIEQFLQDLNEKRLKGKDLPEEVKNVMLDDLRDAYKNVRSRCQSDEEGKQELLKTLGITQ